MTPFTRISVAAALSLALLAGCVPKRDLGDVRVPNPPVPPPAVPKRVDVPIDKALQDKALAELSRAAAAADPYVRANAVETAQRVNTPAGNALVVEAMSDDSDVVRFAATMAAGVLKLKETNPRLLELTRDRDANVRLGARFALHRLGDTRLSHDLEVFATDTDPGIRANTVLALGLLGEPSALKILNGMRSDPFPLVRIQVMESAWRLGDQLARDKLVVGTFSSDPGYQIVCLLALAGPRDVQVRQQLRGSLTSDWPEVSLAAARGLGMLGSDDGYGVALAGTKSKDPRQRSLAALAFGEIGRTDAQPNLAKLLDDSDPSVRIAAAAAVLQLK